MAKPGINSQFNIRAGTKRYEESAVPEKGDKRAMEIRRKIEQLQDDKRLKAELEWL